MKHQPIPILLTSYNRLGFLKQTIEAINARTLYPHYLFVVDNNSTDGTVDYLKSAKTNGKIFDFQIMPENVGQSKALNHLFNYIETEWQARKPMDDFIVTTNEDLIPPKLSPCWLEQMLHTFTENEKEGLGALSMRIQRLARADIDEEKDIIYWNKGIPSVYRMIRRSDILKLGDKPFGELRKFESNTMSEKLKTYLKKRYGFATHIYADHIGWCERKGYGEDVETFTLAENKLNEHTDKEYPTIDKETNVPIEVNSPYDFREQEKRDGDRAKKVVELSEKKKDKRAILRILYEDVSEASISLECALDRAKNYFGDDYEQKIIDYLDKFIN